MGFLQDDIKSNGKFNKIAKTLLKQRGLFNKY